jgi:hypothetical protein
MRCRSAAGKRRAFFPLDEEGKRRLGSRLLDPSDSTAKELAVRPRPRDSDDRHVEASGDVIESVRAEAPAKRPPGLRVGDPASDRALRRLGPVDDRDQLQVRVAERHNPVGRAETLVPAAFDRGQAVTRLDLARGGVEVGDRDQDVIELQR